MRDIFSRVEHAFKKRKDETKVLEIEVGELERNLDYLENQTQDQIKETAALNLAYVHTTAAISSLDENIGAVNGGDLATCKELAENLNLSVESGT